jgi:uncharacterized membrane protein YedE/YeeE
MVKGLVAFACGITFALGLGIGGLTQPARVLAFLDVAGDWDPRLALVMLGAIAVYAPAYRLALRRGRPLLAPAFDLAPRRNIDGALAAGALLFGIGWGLAGLCPGPALTSLGSGKPASILFVVAMVVGIAVHRLSRATATRVLSENALATRPTHAQPSPARPVCTRSDLPTGRRGSAGRR